MDIILIRLDEVKKWGPIFSPLSLTSLYIFPSMGGNIYMIAFLNETSELLFRIAETGIVDYFIGVEGFSFLP